MESLIAGQNQSYAAVSTAADVQLIEGQTPEASNDAVTFAQYAWAAAIDAGYETDKVYVTGHSLGGTEAEAAAAYALPGLISVG